MRVEASTANEVFEAFRVMHAEIEWLLITENEEMKKKVHLFKVEVKTLMTYRR